MIHERIYELAEAERRERELLCAGLAEIAAWRLEKPSHPGDPLEFVDWLEEGGRRGRRCGSWVTAEAVCMAMSYCFAENERLRRAQARVRASVMGCDGL